MGRENENERRENGREGQFGELDDLRSAKRSSLLFLGGLCNSFEDKLSPPPPKGGFAGVRSS